MRNQYTQQAATLKPSILPLPVLQSITAIFIGFVMFLPLAAVSPLVIEYLYRGKIYPGVSIGGVDLSDLRQEEAEAQLFQELDYPIRGRIAFQADQQIWLATPREVGLYLDARTSAQAAYALGRTGNLFERISTIVKTWYSGISLPPLLVYDERVAENFLNEIARQVDIPIVEASLSINGTEVVVKPGQIGRTLDIPAALTALRQPLQAMTDTMVVLQIHQSPPAILDASEQAEFARKILSAPLVIQVGERVEGDPGPWTFEPNQLASMLVIDRVSSPEGDRYQVILDDAQLRTFLRSISPGFVRLPENARFIFNDDTRQLEVIRPAVIGRSLDIETSLQVIQNQIISGEHMAVLDMEYTNPPVTDDATGAGLGITELVSSHTSYFYGSSASRIQNIETASARFHGVLIPPGETFSMADVLGDVSLDTGYAEAWIILGNRTIQGVGGGVCQVSTTLFRTAFLGGFPIVERHPHAYRVGYYEQTSGGANNSSYAGLDATVFVPLVDFKFTNDSSSWLLMETYVSASNRRLTWKFYSTSDGRSVEWDTTGLQNKVEPPEPLYEENSELEKGQIKQVDWAAEGADVTITRTVYRDGGVYFSDQYTTHYMPWQAIYQYGPGTELPEQDE